MKLVALDLNSLAEEVVINADTEYVGLFIGKGDNQAVMRTKFIHQTPNLTSRINIKAVLYDQSRFDIEAILEIADGAANTDTYLKIDCLVVGDNASARAVPSLEIKEDNVKGGHGATIGQIDRMQLHYLQSRGFGTDEAEALLVEAFIDDIQAKIASAI